MAKKASRPSDEPEYMDGFTMVPNLFWVIVPLITYIKYTEIAAYHFLRSRMNGDRQCWVSGARIAQEIRCSESKMDDVLKALRRANLIQVIGKKTLEGAKHPVNIYFFPPLDQVLVWAQGGVGEAKSPPERPKLEYPKREAVALSVISPEMASVEDPPTGRLVQAGEESCEGVSHELDITSRSSAAVPPGLPPAVQPGRSPMRAVGHSRSEPILAEGEIENPIERADGKLSHAREYGLDRAEDLNLPDEMRHDYAERHAFDLIAPQLRNLGLNPIAYEEGYYERYPDCRRSCMTTADRKHLCQHRPYG